MAWPYWVRNSPWASIFFGHDYVIKGLAGRILDTLRTKLKWT